MSGFLVHWLVMAVALLVTTRLVGGVQVNSYATLAVAALIIGFVNALVKPVLVILTLPLTILTLGLFYLVVNGACLMLAAALVPGFTVSSWGSAIVGALVLSVIGWLLSSVLAGSSARALHRPSRPRADRLPADGDQLLLGAHDQQRAGDGRRGHDGLAHRVFREQLETSARP